RTARRARSWSTSSSGISSADLCRTGKEPVYASVVSARKMGLLTETTKEARVSQLPKATKGQAFTPLPGLAHRVRDEVEQERWCIHCMPPRPTHNPPGPRHPPPADTIIKLSPLYRPIRF